MKVTATTSPGASRAGAAPAREAPIVIAHRGASGYLPEHTLAAYALAVHQGADYIEPDLVMTRDGHLIAHHDNVLDLTTDVGARAEFADRRTSKVVDGRAVTGWFSEDFTLAEIKRLRVLEGIPALRATNARFDGQFEVPTLEEIITLVRAYEQALGRGIGIYPETKHPTYFRTVGLPLEQTLVDLLHANGYRSGRDRAYIQSFEIGNLKALRGLTRLRLVQLLAPDGKPYDVERAGEAVTYEKMASAEGLRDIATYADAVGPEKNMVIPLDRRGNLDPARTTDFVKHAHAAGLAVYPYTFRAENHFLPGNFRSSAEPQALGNAEEEIKAFLAVGVDGFFTDHPDTGVRAAREFTNP